MCKYEKWLEHKEFNYNPDYLEHGVLPLHSRIRSFAHFISAASKLFMDKSKHQARGDDRLQARDNKQILQAEFIRRLNLRVEEPRATGGTSTTGNVARRAFASYEITADILGLDPILIKNVGLMLDAVSSHYAINIEEYERLAEETYNIYVTKYGNIPLSPSLHRLLIHGAEVAKSSIVPGGYLSEEATEAKNKTLRFTRAHNSRQDTREHNLTDVFNRSLEESDEVIKSFGSKRRARFRKKNNDMRDDLKKLLKIPQNRLGDDISDQAEEEAQDEEEEELRDLLFEQLENETVHENEEHPQTLIEELEHIFALAEEDETDDDFE